MTRSRKGSYPPKSGFGRKKNGPRTLVCGSAGVVGMGLMGSSIAACLLAAGHTVAGVDADPARVRKASRRVLLLLEGLKEEGLLRSDPRRILRRLTISEDYSGLRPSQIVGE